MDSALPLMAALYAGLAGSMHCVSMCGGIAALGGVGSTSPTMHVLLFNVGRILSYATAGALGAWFIEIGIGFAPSPSARLIVALLTGSVLIILGIYFATGLRVMGALESLGGRFCRRVAPLLGRLLPIRHPIDALAVGALWGWLPCGLVYMALPLAWSTGKPETGALVMAVFGLGTAPAMVGVGLGGGGLRIALRRPAIRRWAGTTMVIFGALMAASPWLVAHGSKDDARVHQGHHASSRPSSTSPISSSDEDFGTACGSSERLAQAAEAMRSRLNRQSLPDRDLDSYDSDNSERVAGARLRNASQIPLMSNARPGQTLGTLSLSNLLNQMEELPESHALEFGSPLDSKPIHQQVLLEAEAPLGVNKDQTAGAY